MAENFKRDGYGQVEPNHLSMQRTGQMHAQLPAHIKNVTGSTAAVKAKDSITLLENGQFAKYDVAEGEVNFNTEATAGEWYLVFNEVKLYGDRYDERYRDYAMKAEAFTDEEMTPRLVKLNIGDLYTTNCFGVAGKYREKVDCGFEIAVGDNFTPGANGYLVKADATATYVLTAVKVYTMPDGTPGVKLMRTK